MQAVTNRIFGYAIAAIVAVGCAPRTAAQFTNTGYQNPTYAYSVGYAEGAMVLPQGWVLDNFFSGPQGLVARKDAGYVTAVHLDRNGDRVPDGVLRIPAYDLRFVHGAHPGVIWLRTFPYSYHLHEKPLEQLVRDYVVYMSATGVEGAIIDDRAPGPPQVGVTVDAQASWMVAGHPAEVLDIRETPTTGGVPRRARVVVARPGFMYQFTNQRRETVLYPVLMVAGYSNSPEQFEVGAADFEAFLGQVTVQGVAGLTKREAAEAVAKEEPTPPPEADDSAGEATPPEADDAPTSVVLEESNDEENEADAEEPEPPAGAPSTGDFSNPDADLNE
jgi:hypothetical protein